MDLYSLEVFLAVAESQSFSGAAERLRLTQPAVSKRIMTLEDSLDTRLFDRLGRQVCLTQAGQALVPRAQRILEEVADSQRVIANLSGHVRGPLKVGISHHIGLKRLPPILKRFARDYPEVELDLEFLESEQSWRGVVTGQFEIAIVTLPPTTTSQMAARTLWTDKMVVVVDSNHSLAKRRSVSLTTLCEHPAVLPSPATITRQLIDHAFGANRPTVRMEAAQLTSLKMLVNAGLGWSVLPQTMVDADLVVLNTSEMRLARRLGAIWHQQRTLSKAAEALLELCAAG